MDDFNVSSLHESKNEWGTRLLSILTPLIIEGLKSIFDEARELCKTNNEMDKYLMTFQNFITRIPKWNPSIIEMEKQRIIEKSGCGYLEDLVTCVHIIQLKLLTAIRVGQKQKKIDINIPKIENFIHKIYINVARKIYKNVYLFELYIPPLQIQKNHRELEIIIQECVLNTIRESIPVESILRAYMDETIEEDVIEEIKEEIIENTKETKNKEEKLPPYIISEQNKNDGSGNVNKSLESNGLELNGLELNGLESNGLELNNNNEIDFPDLSEDNGKITFSNMNSVRDSDNNDEFVNASNPISHFNSDENINYNSDDDSDSGFGNIKLNILEQPVNLENFDVHVLDQPELSLNDNLLLDDIEILA